MYFKNDIITIRLKGKINVQDDFWQIAVLATTCNDMQWERTHVQSGRKPPKVHR